MALRVREGREQQPVTDGHVACAGSDQGAYVRPGTHGHDPAVADRHGLDRGRLGGPRPDLAGIEDGVGRSFIVHGAEYGSRRRDAQVGRTLSAKAA
jgi:hypothetical protein